MGGKGSGGRRVNAGRRRESEDTKRLRGSRRVEKPSGFDSAAAGESNQNATNQKASSQVLIPQPPGNLTLDELAEWNDLAPHAAKAGTFTDDTQWALVDLCQARVLKAKLLRDLDRMGNVVRGRSSDGVYERYFARFDAEPE